VAVGEGQDTRLGDQPDRTTRIAALLVREGREDQAVERGERGSGEAAVTASVVTVLAAARDCA
jgi:hypothetical protein